MFNGNRSAEFASWKVPVRTIVDWIVEFKQSGNLLRLGVEVLQREKAGRRVAPNDEHCISYRLVNQIIG